MDGEEDVRSVEGLGENRRKVKRGGVMPRGSQYQETLARSDEDVSLPHEVVKKTALEGKSLIKAWREHPGLTQSEVARRMEVSQSAFVQMEKLGAALRLTTIKKVAGTLGVEWEQMRE
jgi:DNA-binding XRE family transcriptional regulator